MSDATGDRREVTAASQVKKLAAEAAEHVADEPDGLLIFTDAYFARRRLRIAFLIHVSIGLTKI